MRNYLPLMFTFMAACGTDSVTPEPSSNLSDEELAINIAQGLAQACPPAATNDEAARLACGDNLARFELLRDTMAEPFLWGGQGADKPLDLYENHLTRFNPLVWRKMYASLPMFGSDFRIEKAGDQTVVHVPYSFRNALDGGSYPYPFWHSAAKWDGYQFSTTIAIFIEDGRLLGAMRGAQKDTTRPDVDRPAFDGNWSWESPEGLASPASSVLYSKLFSQSNPMVGNLDSAFRALESKARSQNCNACHSPDNAAKASQLVLLNYPNQAIYARNAIVAELEANVMPTATVDKPAGIQDEAARQELLVLARQFQAAAEQALIMEGERTATAY